MFYLILCEAFDYSLWQNRWNNNDLQYFKEEIMQILA